jgi:hypothetical protein
MVYGEVLGWLGNILILTAIWLIGQKNRRGWIFSILGNAIWCVYALVLSSYSMLFIDGFTLAMGIYYWNKWKESDV